MATFEPRAAPQLTPSLSITFTTRFRQIIIKLTAALRVNSEDGLAKEEHYLTFECALACLSFWQDSTQQSVYDNTARGVVDSSLAGYNATIFAYGQTGTGKVCISLSF
jgi:hypothetical protein